MTEQLKQVLEFRKSFKLPVNKEPVLIPIKNADLHLDLLLEELYELQDGINKGDITEIFDALIDIQYVLLGCVIEHGLSEKFIDGFYEVHKSNMSKLDEQGKPIYNEQGKVMKGKNYFKPNLKAILENERQ